jgi:hypothetical protein
MAGMRNRNRGDALIDLRAAGQEQRAPADGLRKCANPPFGAPVTPIVMSGLPAAVADTHIGDNRLNERNMRIPRMPPRALRQ